MWFMFECSGKTKCAVKLKKFQHKARISDAWKAVLFFPKKNQFFSCQMFKGISNLLVFSIFYVNKFHGSNGDSLLFWTQSSLCEINVWNNIYDSNHQSILKLSFDTYFIILFHCACQCLKKYIEERSLETWLAKDM